VPQDRHEPAARHPAHPAQPDGAGLVCLLPTRRVQRSLPVSERLYVAAGYGMAATQTPPDHLEGPTSPILRRPMVGPSARTGTVQPPPRCAPRATATGAQSSRPPGQPRDEHHPDTARELWSARCLERGTPGAGSGPKKRLDRKTRPRFGPTSPAAFCRRRRCQDVSVGTVDSVAVADRATAYHPALTGMSHPSPVTADRQPHRRLDRSTRRSTTPPAGSSTASLDREPETAGNTVDQIVPAVGGWLRCWSV
jgi:hypothetical protein